MVRGAEVGKSRGKEQEVGKAGADMGKSQGRKKAGARNASFLPLIPCSPGDYHPTIYLAASHPADLDVGEAPELFLSYTAEVLVLGM